MMKILLFNPIANSSIVAYTTMVSGAMSAHAEVVVSTHINDFKKQLSQDTFHLVHLFGAWHWSLAAALLLLHRHHLRYVYTPCGMLEPWVFKNEYWKEKFPKILLFQRSLVRNAYAIVAHGAMERESLSKLKWNTRIEVVYNPLVTTTLTDDEACAQLYSIYRKVLNSNTLALMSSQARTAIPLLIKLYQTKDKRWLTQEEQSLCCNLTETDHYHLLLYAWHEQVYDVFESAYTLLQLPLPSVPPKNQEAYLSAKALKATVVPAFVSLSHPMGNKEVVNYFKQLLKDVEKKCITLKSMIFFSLCLRNAYIDEEKLKDYLHDEKLTKSFSGMLSAVVDYTSLEEGFWPMTPKRTYLTKRIKKSITNHLAI